MLELGVQGKELVFWAIVHLFFCLFVIVPPQAFQLAGFTIPNIFHSYICEERFNFIEHHLRRTSLTIFIHACLPFSFCLLLEYVLPQRILVLYPVNLIQFFAHATILFSIGYSRAIVTDSWILIISNYTVDFAQTSDLIFRVVKVANHPYLSQDDSGFQLVDVEIESISKKMPNFKIRVHSQEMLDDLERKLNRRINILNGIVISATLYERFVTVFLKQIQDNPKFVYPNKEELDPCLGCSLNLTNVKISRTCDNNTDPDGQNCGVCRCRPMWCGSCMARVFASKQNKDHPEVWMSGKADCPTCRSAFCVLDVCPLE